MTAPDFTMTPSSSSSPTPHLTSSPSSSEAGTSSDQGEATPKAEHPPHPRPRPHLAGTQRRRGGELERSSSWKKRHASLDAPPTLPLTHSSYFPSFSSDPPISPPDERPGRSTRPEPCRRLDSSPSSLRSSSSSCLITGSNSPPAHYPTTSLQQQLEIAIPDVAIPEGSPTSAPMMSSASTSSSVSSDSSIFKTPPDSFQDSDSQWSSLPVPHRVGSFGTATGRPDLLVAEDVEEIVKGEDARVTVHTRKEVYEVWVSLPGFKHENITVSTKQARTLHIVADEWDLGDHAQWDIKLGDDAQMSSIRAIFKGDYLNVIIPRRTPSNALLRSSSSRATNNSGKSDYDRDLLAQHKERELEQQAKAQQTKWLQACDRSRSGSGWDVEREKREMEAKMGGVFCWGKSKDGATG